ncbi:Oidioi.mRNA.OKI2018_I69.chr1.g1006.t1.cds [Oikopleura dioica]|uniref:Oidioi.mRNA.OKI2018_I69.chr1.g1006.t1.cds n=1 Tax=Oikopleura dioica TaxID=34765 RepID=A0ABN7SLM0_OIKDI|nr:Oidioi.mRNA.OKI2018_I69.chr1.g1006.t1.cds [Oikopleura dioica]
MENIDRLLVESFLAQGDIAGLLRYKENPTPHPRSGHRLCFINGYLWLIGGYVHFLPLSRGPRVPMMEIVDKEVWRFDPMLSNWKKMEVEGEPPKTMASHALCSSGTVTDQLINLHVYDTELSRWSKLDDHLNEENDFIPEGVYGHSLVIVKDSLYIIGGTAGQQFFNSVNRFDLGEKKWERVFDHIVIFNEEDDVPSGRYRQECVTYMERWIFMIGGGTSAELKANISEPDDLEIREFQPPDVRCHSLAIDGSTIYMVGGFLSSSREGRAAGTSKCSDAIWKLDINPERLSEEKYNPKILTLNWIKIQQNLPQPIFFHDSVYAFEHGEIFVFGGNNKNGKRNNDLTRLRIQPGSLETLSKKVKYRHFGEEKTKFTCL